MVIVGPIFKRPRNERTFAVAALVGSRHIVTLMLFLGMANAYVMRTNMSVAIVAMINHTAIVNKEEEPLVNECGIVNSSMTSVSTRRDAVDARCP